MPELTDEQILDIQDDAPSTDVSEAHEGTAPEDSSLNESTSEPIQETSNALETKTPDEVSGSRNLKRQKNRKPRHRVSRNNSQAAATKPRK